MTTDIKEWIATGRKYADAIDKDRGFESGVTDCLRSLCDALEAMAGEVARETKAAGYWMERSCTAENERDRLAGEVERLKAAEAELRDGIEDMQRQRIDNKVERDRLKEALLDIKHFGTGFAQDRARKALGGDA